jgi:AraC family transcriptional regulator
MRRLWWSPPVASTWQKLRSAHPSDPVREALRQKSEQGLPGSAAGRLLAQGSGWLAQDVVCSSGPRDRPFEERHERVSVAVVLAGTFTYGNAYGRSLLTPGALLLGDVGGCFTCGHEHGSGDRCLAFHFEPACFEGIAADLGARNSRLGRNNLPTLRTLSPLVARAIIAADTRTGFAELALDLAAAALHAAGECRLARISSLDERRVAAVVRHLEEHFDRPCSLDELARLAALSPFHFLRVFRAVTGLTPHQYLLRARLRAAATLLVTTHTPVTEVALCVGFEDLSNFTRSFGAEYRLTPTRYRAQLARP